MSLVTIHRRLLRFILLSVSFVLYRLYVIYKWKKFSLLSLYHSTINCWLNYQWQSVEFYGLVQLYEMHEAYLSETWQIKLTRVEDGETESAALVHRCNFNDRAVRSIIVTFPEVTPGCHILDRSFPQQYQLFHGEIVIAFGSVFFHLSKENNWPVKLMYTLR